MLEVVARVEELVVEELVVVVDELVVASVLELELLEDDDDDELEAELEAVGMAAGFVPKTRPA